MTCWHPYCDKPTSFDMRGASIELCHSHAWEIATRYRHAILAEAQLTAAKSAGAANEREQVAQGNPGGEPVVYYAAIGDYIKIGYTTRLRNRLTTLRVDRLLAQEPGGPELERQRHKEFTAERIDLRRENFRASDRLTTHIEALHERHGLPLWATRPRTSEVTIRHKGDA